MVVAGRLNAPGDEIDEPAEGHCADSEAEKVNVIGVDQTIKRICNQRRAQTDGGAKADEGRRRRQQAAEDMRQEADDADRKRGMTQLFSRFGGSHCDLGNGRARPMHNVGMRIELAIAYRLCDG